MGRIYNVAVTHCNGDTVYQSYRELKEAAMHYYRKIAEGLEGRDVSFPGQVQTHIYLVVLTFKDLAERIEDSTRLVYHVNSGFFECSYEHQEAIDA